MNKERLLLLADYLEGKKKFKGRAVPANKFDLEHYMEPYSAFSNKKFDVPKGAKKKKFETVKEVDGTKLVKPIDCQTAGCAIGWACSIPEFNEQGLFLEELDGGQYHFPILIQNDKIISCRHNASEIFFEIDSLEFICLFQPSSYPNGARNRPDLVAKRIRKFVKTGELV